MRMRLPRKQKTYRFVHLLSGRCTTGVTQEIVIENENALALSVVDKRTGTAGLVRAAAKETRGLLPMFLFGGSWEALELCGMRSGAVGSRVAASAPETVEGRRLHLRLVSQAVSL